MKLVQMPPELIHVEDADLAGLGVDPGLIAAYRAYLPDALTDRRGAAILAPAAAGTRAVLMVLARRIGAALRDENIDLRDRGGDLKAGRQKLCYLPGPALPVALADPGARHALTTEAVCFLQDLDAAWSAAGDDRAGDDRAGDDRAGDDRAEGTAADTESALLDLLGARLAAGRPTILSADPDRLPDAVRRGLAGRLRIIRPG